LRLSDMKRSRLVRVDWNNMKSIKSAEKMKARLENIGYSLTNTVSGANSAVLVYNKKK